MSPLGRKRAVLPMVDMIKQLCLSPAKPDL